jgi:hypothetical protein
MKFGIGFRQAIVSSIKLKGRRVERKETSQVLVEISNKQFFSAILWQNPLLAFLSRAGFDPFPFTNSNFLLQVHSLPEVWAYLSIQLQQRFTRLSENCASHFRMKRGQASVGLSRWMLQSSYSTLRLLYIFSFQNSRNTVYFFGLHHYILQHSPFITDSAIVVDRRKMFPGSMVLSILVTIGTPVSGTLEIRLAKVILVAVFSMVCRRGGSVED